MAAYEVARLTVLVVVAAVLALALGSWAVTTRRIPPFSPVARLVRRLSDPLVEPVERWLVRRGRNPQDAPWWLLGGAIIGGILLLTAAEWAIRTGHRLASGARPGPRGAARLAVYFAAQVFLFALIARVVGSWLGAGRYNRWLRPAYRLTDWMVEPLRRFIPPIGVVDITPLVAWVLLQLVLSIVMRSL
jgi:YggT family protein